MPYKMTSSFTEPCLRRAARRGARGAVFVEAIALTSALTLGLLALVYLRDLYVQELAVSRLIRAGVLAHSMAGCKANEPRDWLGRDVREYTGASAGQDQRSAHGKDDSGAGSGANSTKASDLLQRSGSASADGKGLLNPITDSALSGQARAAEKDGARDTTVFAGRVRATSYVSCGDEVRDGDFEQVLGVMKDEFSTLLGK